MEEEGEKEADPRRGPLSETQSCLGQDWSERSAEVRLVFRRPDAMTGRLMTLNGKRE